MLKKVSVILTTYNSESSVKRMIQSILDQEGAGTAFDLEIIVVDDCSTDRTVEILRQLPVTLLSTEKNSGGPNAGRNIGLRAVSGDYICIADHDDTWYPNKIITTLPYLERVPIVTCGHTLTDTSKGTKKDRFTLSEGPIVYHAPNDTFLHLLKRVSKGQHTYLGGIIYSSKLRHVLFEETFGMSDLDWVLGLFHTHDSIEICAPLYNRNVDGSNLSLNETYRQKDFYHSLLSIETYMDHYPKEYLISYKRMHGTRARYYYLIGNMKRARFYFRRSGFSLKTVMYYLTTFVGSGYVRKKFNIFG